MLAPTSSTVVRPFSVGQLRHDGRAVEPPGSCAGSAWRWPAGRRCCRRRRRPGPRRPLPISTAFHRLEPLPRRRAWAAFSALAIVWAVWRTSLSALSRPVPGEFGRDGRVVAVEQEAHLAPGQAVQRQRQAVDHDGRALVPAHGVDGDHGRGRHGRDITFCSGGRRAAESWRTRRPRGRLTSAPIDASRCPAGSDLDPSVWRAGNACALSRSILTRYGVDPAWRQSRFRVASTAKGEGGASAGSGSNCTPGFRGERVDLHAQVLDHVIADIDAVALQHVGRVFRLQIDLHGLLGLPAPRGCPGARP